MVAAGDGAAGAGVLAAASDAPGAGLVRPPRLDRHRPDRLDPHPDQRDPDPARPVAPPRPRRVGGRLDRLDLWILIVLVVAAMCLRTFRLAEPARMHFDEVYHARTAAEFLQDWRYGLSHYIYEWTHPHLAKYAMAGGIVLFAGHDTSATQRARYARQGCGDRAPPARPALGDGSGR